MPEGKTYNLSIRRRFDYTRRYTIVKRLEEEKENPYIRKIREFIYKFTGRKGEKR